MSNSGGSCGDSPYLAVIDDGSFPPATYLDNTLGGPLRLPRCLAGGFEPTLVLCSQCGRPMLSLVQLSCPLIGLDCRRFLYFFLCPNAACLEGVAAMPLRCLRAQVPCGAAPKASASRAGGGSGIESNGGRGISYNEWGDGADDWGDGSDGVNEVAEELEVEPEAGEEANAEGEAETAQAATYAVQDLPWFEPCRQLAVFDEAELLAPAPVDHQLAATIRSAEEQLQSDGGVGDTAGADDEQNQALTKLEQKFYSRLAACPGQVLRYQWSGRPLLVTPLPSGRGAPACQLCGNQRSFELQLMPGLLDAMRGVSGGGVGGVSDRLDLATALVFTCGASCQPPADRPFAEEAILVQRELPPPQLR